MADWIHAKYFHTYHTVKENLYATILFILQILVFSSASSTLISPICGKIAKLAEVQFQNRPARDKLLSEAHHWICRSIFFKWRPQGARQKWREEVHWCISKALDIVVELHHAEQQSLMSHFEALHRQPCSQAEHQYQSQDYVQCNNSNCSPRLLKATQGSKFFTSAVFF